MAASTPTLPIRFGRYLLVERIAKGGMAEIFRATASGALGFEKSLIIKRILPELATDREFVRMFAKEARLVCNLQHPNIVQVYELDQVQGVYYIAMEHVEGTDAHVLWRTLAHRGQRLPAQLALYVVSEFLKGLAFAHQAVGREGQPLGVVHRDVSPSNVLISSQGEVKIGDFGVALVKHESSTRSGVLKGKYGYMTPEQLAGLPVDSRSDLFSAGVVLAELLTGRRLFRGPTDFETMRLVLNVRLGVLDAHEGQLDPALLRLVRRALRRDPAERFQTAATFCDAATARLEPLQGRRRIDGKTLAAFVAQHVSPYIEGAQRPPTDPTASFASAPPSPVQIAVHPPPDAAEPETEPELRPRTASTKAAGWIAADTLIDPPAHAGWDDTTEPGEAASQAPIEDVPTNPREGDSALIVFAPPMTAEDPSSDAGATGRSDSLLIEVAPPRREESLLIELPPPPRPSLEPPERPAGAPRVLELSASGEFADTGFGGGGGDLSAVTAARLLFRYLVGGASGLLVLTGPRATSRLSDDLRWVEALGSELGFSVSRRPGRATCQLHLRAGRPKTLSADRSEALLAAHLLQMKALTREELAAAARPFPAFKPVTALLAGDRLAPLELTRYVNSFVQWSLLDAFSWTEGEFTFYPGRGQPPDAFLTGLNMMQLITTGISVMEEAALDRYFDRAGARRVELNTRPTVEVQQLQGDPLFAAICRLLGDQRPLEQALAACLELDEPRRVKQALFFLIECEVAELQ